MKVASWFHTLAIAGIDGTVDEVHDELIELSRQGFIVPTDYRAMAGPVYHPAHWQWTKHQPESFVAVTVDGYNGWFVPQSAVAEDIALANMKLADGGPSHFFLEDSWPFMDDDYGNLYATV